MIGRLEAVQQSLKPTHDTDYKRFTILKQTINTSQQGKCQTGNMFGNYPTPSNLFIDETNRGGVLSHSQ